MGILELSPPPHKVTSCGHSHLASTSHAPLYVKIISLSPVEKFPKSHEATPIPSKRYLLRATKYLETKKRISHVKFLINRLCTVTLRYILARIRFKFFVLNRILPDLPTSSYIIKSVRSVNKRDRIIIFKMFVSLKSLKV